MPIQETPVYTFSLLVATAEQWPYVVLGSLTLVEAEGGQIDTLTFTLEDYDGTLNVVEYQEVVLTATYGATVYKLFGGYAVKITPEPVPGGGHLQWVINCEGYGTLFNKGIYVRKTYVNQTTKAIVAALFTTTGLSEFNVTDHVATGMLHETFTTDEAGEALSKILDRLVQLNADVSLSTWAWRIDVDKNLWLGPQSSDTAPFALATLDAADWTTSFPMLSTPTKTTDATQIINRVTVRGGFTPSGYQTDYFSGTGSLKLFLLTHRPILDVVRVRIGSTRFMHGFEWHNDAQLGSTYSNLTDFASGTLRFNTPPGSGYNNIQIKYRYRSVLSAVVSDAESYAKYGRYFDYEYSNRNISSVAQAEALAGAILNKYADCVVGGSFEVARLGIRAGQRVQIEFPLLKLTGYYPARQVTTEIDASGAGVVCSVMYGSHADKLSVAAASAKIALIGFGIETPPPYDETASPESNTSAGTIRVIDRLEIIDPNTDYTP